MTVLHVRTHLDRHTLPPEPLTYKNLPDLPSNWTKGKGREWVGVAVGGGEGQEA